MLVAEKELSVQVGEIDGVKVDNVDFAEAGQHQVLEELTANAASTNHEHASLHKHR